MIPALVAALSVPGLWCAWFLLRPPPMLARELGAWTDDPDVVRLGGDWSGLVD